MKKYILYLIPIGLIFSLPLLGITIASACILLLYFSKSFKKKYYTQGVLIALSSFTIAIMSMLNTPIEVQKSQQNKTNNISNKEINKVENDQQNNANIISTQDISKKQNDESCKVCHGKGCNICDNTGVDQAVAAENDVTISYENAYKSYKSALIKMKVKDGLWPALSDIDDAKGYLDETKGRLWALNNRELKDSVIRLNNKVIALEKEIYNIMDKNYSSSQNDKINKLFNSPPGDWDSESKKEWNKRNPMRQVK